jgi:hypothetical protein
MLMCGMLLLVLIFSSCSAGESIHWVKDFDMQKKDKSYTSDIHKVKLERIGSKLSGTIKYPKGGYNLLSGTIDGDGNVILYEMIEENKETESTASVTYRGRLLGASNLIRGTLAYKHAPEASSQFEMEEVAK